MATYILLPLATIKRLFVSLPKPVNSIFLCGDKELIHVLIKLWLLRIG